MEKPGREKEVRGKKGTGSREREKEKDGNGKDGRIYPLGDIWDYLSIIWFENEAFGGITDVSIGKSA